MKKLKPKLHSTKKLELIVPSSKDTPFPPNLLNMSSHLKYLITIALTAILTILTLGCSSEINSSIDKTQITGSISYQNIQVDYGDEASSTAQLTNITPTNAINSDYSYSANPPLPSRVILNQTNGTITVASNAPGFSNTYTITATSTVTGNDPQYMGSVTGTISIKVNHFSARSFHSVVAFNNELYLIGGYGGGSYKNDVWKSSDGSTWIEVTTTQSKFSGREGHSVVEFNNALYLIGGNGGSSLKNDVWKSSNGVTWTQVTTNQAQTQATNQTQFTRRQLHSVVAFNNELYLIGGADGAYYNNNVWKSSDGSTWTQVTTTQSKFSGRYAHSVVEFNNALYLIGGNDGNNNNDVWKSSDGVTWTEVTNQAQFSARNSHSVVAFNNELYLIGGYDGSYYNDVWKSSDGVTWTQVTTTQSKFSRRTGHSVVEFNNALYLIGGNGGGIRYNDVWKSSDGIDWEQKL